MQLSIICIENTYLKRLQKMNICERTKKAIPEPLSMK